MKIAIFSSLWGSSTGGIDVVNMELVKALSQLPRGPEVCACMQVRTESLHQDSKKYGFQVAAPESSIPKDLKPEELGSWDEKTATATLMNLMLNLKFSPDVVVLNDIFCRILPRCVREYLPETKIVTLFHSAYGRSEKAKGIADTEIARKTNYQAEMIEESDLSLAVGSFSEDYLRSIARSEDAPISSFVPGLPKIESTPSRARYFNAMSFGRVDAVSNTIKMIDLSCQAWRLASQSGDVRLETKDTRFYAIGARGGDSVLAAQKHDLARNSEFSIYELPFEDVSSFDKSQLKNKMEECAFVLLNSWYENFGLTFLETCTFGVPAIISQNSGFYHELTKILDEEQLKTLVFSVQTNGVSPEEIVRSIQNKMIAGSIHYDRTFKNAQKLREILRDKWPSWDKVARDLIAEITDRGLLRDEKVSVPLHEEMTGGAGANTAPWPETIGDLFAWCWKNNRIYSNRLKNQPILKSVFPLPLTQMQKEFWDRRDDLLEHRFKDVILSGGTSSGKTTIAEHLFGLARPEEFSHSRILYIAPTKALAQEKARYWKQIFHAAPNVTSLFEPVIVSTGDDNASDGALMRGDFNIASTVYEKANVLLKASQDLLSKINMVVIDEFHMVEDLHRGSILECLLAKIKLEKMYRQKNPETSADLRVVVITTENTDGSLENFLKFKDPGTEHWIPPMVVTDTSRARAVAHNVIVCGRREDGSQPLFEIKTFAVSDQLVLSEAQSKKLSSAFEVFQANVQPIPDGFGFDKQRKRREYYKEFVDRWMTQNQFGRRLLVFMSSKFETLETAAPIKNHIKGRVFSGSMDRPNLEVNTGGIDPLLTKISQVEQTDFTLALASCVEQGVFIHNADVPQKVRAEFEAYLSKPLASTFRSEIIFATETLSFGVNLQVTDVALFNVLFPESERIRKPGPLPHALLQRCDFVNMAGRAGRLGQGDVSVKPNVYWFIDPEEAPSFETVINCFYVDPPHLKSSLFHSSDSTICDDIKRELRDRQKVQRRSFLAKITQQEEARSDIPLSSAVEKFSYPFARSVLDGLRFLGGTEDTKGFEGQVGCTIDDLCYKFFRNTLYFSTNCGEDEELVEKREYGLMTEENEEPQDDRIRDIKRNKLEDAIELVLTSAFEEAYSLVKETTQGQGNYRITQLGSSTIDTGTEISTVTKLRRALLELNGFWESQSSREPLPFELAVLPLFFQQEVHRQFLLKLPEFRHAIEWNPIENRNDLVSRSCDALMQMKSVNLDQERLSMVVREFVEWTVKNQSIDAVDKRYEQKAHDSCLRLYIAFLAWISGKSQRAVIGEVQKLYPTAPRDTNSSVFNFEAFAENLTWKILFLVSLLRASNEKILPSGSTFDAVRFVHRSRFGCREKAIPLLHKNRSGLPPLNRVQVHDLLAHGLTAADIALGKTDEKTSLGLLQRRQVRDHVRSFIQESFQELAGQFNLLAEGKGLNKRNEGLAANYWEFAQRQVNSLISSATPLQVIWWDGGDEDTAEYIVSTDADMGNAEPYTIISKQSDGIVFRVYSPRFDDSDTESEAVKMHRSSEFIARFSFGDEGEEFGSLDETTMVVDFPWTAGVHVEAENLCRLSPAAFGILLSLCARNFVVDVESYIRSILTSGLKEPIGVRALYGLSERHLTRFPESLFEAWAKHIEVGEF